MSDKPSVGEMLENIKIMRETIEDEWGDQGEEDKRIYDAIRALILASDKGPGVKKEAVEKCVNRLHYWSREANKPSEEFIRNRIKDLLREAGMSVIPVKEKEKP